MRISKWKIQKSERKTWKEEAEVARASYYISTVDYCLQCLFYFVRELSMKFLLDDSITSLFLFAILFVFFLCDYYSCLFFLGGILRTFFFQFLIALIGVCDYFAALHFVHRSNCTAYRTPSVCMYTLFGFQLNLTLTFRKKGHSKRKWS